MASNRLTWDQVEAPDFRGVLDGYVAASGLIGNAMKSAQTGLDRLKDTQTNNADNAVMAELLKYQGNPDGLTAALGSGEFQGKVDMSKISAGMREHLSKAPADLLKFATDKQTYDQRQIVAGQAAYVRENQEVANAVVEATMQGDKDRLAAIKQARPDFFQKVDTNWLVGAYRDGFSLQQNDLGNQRAGFELGSDVEDRSADQQANEWFERFTFEGTGEAGANAEREALQAKNPLAFQKLMSRFAGIDPLGGAGAGGLGGGGDAGPVTSNGLGATAAGGGDPTRVMNYEARAAGFGVVPASITTFGQASDFAKQVNRAGVKSSAMGVYQIVGETMRGKDGDNGYAKKALGANWRSAEFNFENQDKIAEQIFLDHNGSAEALRKQWVSLSPAEAERARKLPWAQAREIIAKGESSVSPAAIADPRRAGVAVQTAIAQGASSDPNRAKLLDFGQAWDKTSTVTQVAAGLVGEGGAFAGSNQNAVEDLVKKVMDLGVNNADVAGAILSRNKAGQENLLQDLGDNALTNAFGLGDGLTQNYNWDGIKNDVKLALDRPGLQAAALSESDRQFGMQQMAASTATVNNLIARRDAAQADALLRGRRFNPAPWDMMIAQAQGRQTGAFRGAAQTAGATDPGNNPGDRKSHNPPPPPPSNDDPFPVRQARNIVKLGGKIREKQEATFKATYGMTPAEAIKNPAGLPQTGQSVTVALNGGRPQLTKSQLTIEANAALLQGAAAIKAFTKLYGQHPQTLLNNM